MAREAGFWRNAFSQACARHSNGSWVDVAEELERFAALVAAAEREACAQIAEMAHPDDWPFIAAAIRSRITP